MLKQSTSSFVDLVREIDGEYRTQRDRGTLFELLVKTYLKNEPVYARLFDDVWLLKDVPEEYGIPKVDTGVDLVARKAKTGELVAIQAKYYDKNTKIGKAQIDSFLNEVGKRYYAEGLVVTTTDQWTTNADEALKDRDKPIMRISLSQLKESQVDWSRFTFSKPEEVELQDKKTPRPHQIPAINNVVEGFKKADRGKLIMAPGTGKTFTSMAIAEEMATHSDDIFKVLYLVPSIQLLSQTLRAWNADINYEMDSIAVCSDRKVTKQSLGTELEDIATTDIGFPATTNSRKLLEYQETIEKKHIQPEFITVFSTYQSIDVIIEAQKNGFYEFDLVICDEAHRTTGATEAGQEGSAFTKVHSNNHIKAKKRLYQTATPRVYGEDARRKAEEKSVIIADMNDPEIYGEEFHRIGFGEAVRRGILTDYKVMVLAVDEEVIARRFQDMFSKTESGLQFDDVTKIVGCWNGLVKRDGETNKTLGQPMKRAIAFTGTIKDSKLITEMFQTVVDEYLYRDDNSPNNQFRIDIQHADGTMNAVEKNEKIDWLKSEIPENTCRVLSNARFLTEGVDVPDLDAVMFLKPRRSEIDIAQAVGRVMRKAPGKDYGYIILPIGVPAGAEAHSILDNNEKYAVVWEILNALRSIDERFDATINKLELNKKKPNQISVVGIGDAPVGGELEYPDDGERTEQLELELDEENLSDLERAIYGKIVQKVGNVRYWEQWSEDVAKIAQQHMTRINVMLEDKKSHVYKEFKKFMKSIRYNINDTITEQQAIEMLAQHLITKPVFESLFETYSFVNNNPVSQAMESILDLLDKQGLQREQEQLEDFYESVRIRAEGIDNLKAKQDIIIQLYEKFFKVAFKETTERLGIVFTPTEVVDFIIHSVDDVLKKHFGKSLASEGVHILDPFTGTGTFITRLLQSGLIPKEDLLRKYTQEIHANEIVLLSYYIAAINIEETFHSLYGGDYVSFEGIVLTDTFESTEKENTFEDILFNENNARLKKQQKEPIFAIIGNPPYSVGARDENLSAKLNSYPKLDDSIKRTFAKHSKSKSIRGVYDSYIRALRWSTDRLNSKGIVGFITNSSYLDSTSTDGVRKCLYEEYNHIYILDLKGAIRGKIGNDAKREGQNIFDIMTGVAICILVKDDSDEHNVFYKDIGSGLSKKDKLNKITEFQSIINIEWKKIVPDNNNDWINQRDKRYLMYPEILGEIFYKKVDGVQTNRDAWVYSFSDKSAQYNAERLIENYNEELKRLKNIDKKNKLDHINTDPTYISWSRALKKRLERNEEITSDGNVLVSMYRPFVKKKLYYKREIIEYPREFDEIDLTDNLVLSVTGISANKDFSVLAIDTIPNYDMLEKGRHFLLNNKKSEESLIEIPNNNIIENYSKKLKLSDIDTMYYIYGILHSKEYRDRYRNNLKKELPRIPFVKNKQEFIDIGMRLVNLHLNYENVEPYSEIDIEFRSTTPSYKVKKMRFPKRDKKETIIFNEDITIRNVPEKAYEYIINGRSAIEWIMNQYQVKTNSRSGITDDPNLYSDDEKYIFNLLLSIINVSIQTVNLINSLPPLEIDE